MLYLKTANAKLPTNETDASMLLNFFKPLESFVE